MGRVIAAVLVLAMLTLAGCTQESKPPAERQEQKQEASEQTREQASSTRTPASETGRVGDTVQAGPFLVTLNDAKARLSREKDREDHHYAVADLTLENRERDTVDAAEADYLLRDEEGYSFEQDSLPDQKPQPQGQVMPDGKASGEVAFDLGKEPVEGRLTLAISFSGEQEAAPAVFEFELEPVEEKPESKPEAEKKDKAKPKADTGEQPHPAEHDYEVVADPSGNLKVEVPPDWEAEIGSVSEGEGGPNSWSYYAGEEITASITTARSLEALHDPNKETTAAYLIASRTLARNYTDDELLHGLLFKNLDTKCTPGPYEDYERSPYVGKTQTWYGCVADDDSYILAAAAPEGRECVVVLSVLALSDADREAAEHILDSFEVDCEALPPPAPPASGASAIPSASATSSASPEPSASASAQPNNPNSSADSCPNWRITPDGMQCSNLPDVIPGSATPNPSAPDAPASGPSTPSNEGQCPQGGRWVGIDGPGDGDSDGCAGEP